MEAANKNMKKIERKTTKNVFEGKKESDTGTDLLMLKYNFIVSRSELRKILFQKQNHTNF